MHSTTVTHEVAGWIPPVARLGYAAKGVVYMLVGGLALAAARGPGQVEGSRGALAELLDARYGTWLVALVALGLAGHVVWRLIQATLDPEHPGEKRLGARLFYLLSGLIYGALGLYAARLAAGDSDSSTTQPLALVLGWPGGQFWLYAIAALITGYGAYQVYKAFAKNIARKMGIPAQTHGGVVLLGRFGTAARGIVLMIVGWLVFSASRGYSAQATEAGTADALQTIEPSWLLGVIALGFVAYGIFQIAKALYRRIEPPA